MRSSKRRAWSQAKMAAELRKAKMAAELRKAVRPKSDKPRSRKTGGPVGGYLGCKWRWRVYIGSRFSQVRYAWRFVPL